MINKVIFQYVDSYIMEELVLNYSDGTFDTYFLMPAKLYFYNQEQIARHVTGIPDISRYLSDCNIKHLKNNEADYILFMVE